MESQKRVRSDVGYSHRTKAQSLFFLLLIIIDIVDRETRLSHTNPRPYPISQIQITQDNSVCVGGKPCSKNLKGSCNTADLWMRTQEDY